MSDVFRGLTGRKSVSFIWWEVKMEEVRYIICNLFRGLKEKEQPSAFVLENLNNKNPLRGHIQGSKT